jgi:signal transduction histidine kinase
LGYSANLRFNNLKDGDVPRTESTVHRFLFSVQDRANNMSEPHRSENLALLELQCLTPQASLESILCTEELRQRPSRRPDYEKENRALVMLGGALADSPATIFQKLSETILEITQCESAGLSLLTLDGKTPDVCGKTFYWPAIAGVWNPHVGGGTPRNFGPCGDVLDQNRTLLFRHFERRYPYLLPVIPAAAECLLVPFYVANEAVGTIWAIMHSDRRKFDAEDERVMAALGRFASSAYQARMHIESLKVQVDKRERAEADLRNLAESLEGQVLARTEELRHMTQKLMEAQEQERTRIARELHDDVNQRLALLTVELEQLRDAPSEIQTRVQELLKQTSEISNDIQTLAHDLHSSQLEYLGLVAGIKSWIREFGKHQGMQVDYRHSVRSPLPPEVGLCLFRVLQESLHNAAKHSGAKRIQVELAEDAGEIHLTIRDLGKGFDIETARQGRGLGLTSMRERVRLVNGSILIHSKPKAGTTIQVRVPISAAQQQATA